MACNAVWALYSKPSKPNFLLSLLHESHQKISLSFTLEKLSLSSSRLKISLSLKRKAKISGSRPTPPPREWFPKAGLTTNLTPYSAIKSFVVGLRIMMNCRWRLLGHNEWRRWLQGQFGGVAVMGMGIFFFFFLIFWFGFCLGLRCESCDVWWLERFGFEEIPNTSKSC